MRRGLLRFAGLGCSALLLVMAACSSSEEDASSPAAAEPAGETGWGGGAGANQHGSSDAGASKAGASGALVGAAGAAGASTGEQNGAGGSCGAAYYDAGAMDAAPLEADGATDDAQGDGGDKCAVLDQSKPLVLYQSADDSNSMASPVIARSLINRGQAVPGWLIRPYEFLNYYRIGFEPAAHGQVRVVAQMRPGEEAGDYALQVGVQAEQAAAVRRTMNIIFVLDTSGSMGGQPIALERAAVKAIAASMKAGDTVSMVTWNSQQSVILDTHVVSGPSDSVLLAAADALEANGSTDLHGGLVKGYELAKKSYQPSIMNRVVVISDGQANVGVVDKDLIAKESHAADGEGIYLVGVGVGDGVNDTLMNTVTDKGRGAYVYLDSEQEATRVFGSRFDETMEVAVRDIRLELTVPWYFALQETSAEQTSTNPEEVDPQYLAPSDAIVFQNSFQACSASLVNPSDPILAKATYTRPFTQEAAEDSVSTTVGELLEGADGQLKKGAAIVAYAKALTVAGTVADRVAAADHALALAEAADPEHTDAELAEIRDLLVKHKAKLW